MFFGVPEAHLSIQHGLLAMLGRRHLRRFCENPPPHRRNRIEIAMAASKVYLVGAGQPSLEDVVHVIRGLEVALDSAAADRVKKDSPPPKSFQADEPRDASGDSPLHPGDCLDQAQTRAAILFKLVSLVNGKSKARVSVLQTLVSLLNARINPCLRSGDLDQQALAALADALQGLGCVVQQANGGSVVSAADALQAAGIEAPGLSAAERAALQDGQCASGGTGAICVQFGGALLTAAGAVAALAAEALQADVGANSPRESHALCQQPLICSVSHIHNTNAAATPLPCLCRSSVSMPTSWSPSRTRAQWQWQSTCERCWMALAKSTLVRVVQACCQR